MTAKKKLLAISGSTRQSSSNLHLIQAIAALSADVFALSLYDGLLQLPAFNPDAVDDLPTAVQALHEQLAAADAVLICTPEYAAGVPGALKNAIDWTVASMSFSQKPVALITAGTSGHLAHQSLLGTLLIIESKITNDTQLVISAVKTKVTAAGEIAHVETKDKVARLVQALAAISRNEVAATDLLPAPVLVM